MEIFWGGEEKFIFYFLVHFKIKTCFLKCFSIFLFYTFWTLKFAFDERCKTSVLRSRVLDIENTL